MHEFDGHGVDASPEDQDGKIMLESELSSMYVQNGIESARQRDRRSIWP